MSDCSIAPQGDKASFHVRPGKWTFTIIGLLRTDTLRFNELRRLAEGISQKTLSTTLRELERDGFVGRTSFPTIPPRVDYSLTALGRELLHMVDLWFAFAARNRGEIETARQFFDQAEPAPVLRLVHSAE